MELCNSVGSMQGEAATGVQLRDLEHRYEESDAITEM